MENRNTGSEGNALIAVYPILYHARQYRVGETLPTNDADMVAAWLEAGTAKWRDGESPEPDKEKEAVPETTESPESDKEKKAVSETTESPEPDKGEKAVPETAEPGLSGYNSTSTETDGDDLVGKVPKTKQRKK